MARRGVNEGTIYQRQSDKRWVGVLHVGYSGGKRQRKSFYGATRQEVASRLAGLSGTASLASHPSLRGRS